MGDSLARRSTWGKGPRGSTRYMGYVSVLQMSPFISTCQCPPASALNPYPGSGKGVKKVGRRTLPGEWWLRVASPCGWTSH